MEKNGQYKDWREYLKNDFVFDLRASIVVFLVALPLCMGIALASGVPADKAAAAGLITGIVGGIVVGCLGGSPLQVSGPAAGLSVLVMEFIHTHGYEKLGAVVLMAGVFQFIAGILRWGQVFRAVAPAVIQGMLAGIGFLIIASQFHGMLDHSIPGKNGIENLAAFPQSIYEAFVGDAQHRWAAAMGIATIAIIVLWGSFAPKKLRLLPGALLGVIVAATIAVLVQAEFGVAVKRIQMPDSLFSAIQPPTWETILSFQSWSMWQAALVIAAIASAETLLCATAVDKMHQGPRTRFDRELWAQGIGNMVCGFCGTLPMTGVIVRSSANVDAGARTRVSAILHGVWLLLLVAFIPGILALIPLASLAAILVLAGYKLINPPSIYRLYQYSRSEFLIYLATVTVIVVEDLLIGVLVGIALSAVKLLYTFSRLNIRVEEDVTRGVTEMYLEGTATFIRLPKLAAALERIPPNTELHVHLDKLNYIDHACLDLLINWEKQHEATGGSLVIDWETLTARFRRPQDTVARADYSGPIPAQPDNGQAAVVPANPKAAVAEAAEQIEQGGEQQPAAPEHADKSETPVNESSQP